MINEEKDGEVAEKILDAKHVYLLMKKEYRISRNIRAAWYFQHLHTLIKYTPSREWNDPEQELTVLSVVSQTNEDLKPGTEYSFRLHPATIISFIARRYRLLFALDLSPSISSVDICSGRVLFREAFNTLCNCLRGIIKPFKIPGSSILISPQIYITVLAHTPLITSCAKQVLAQGVLLNEDNVEVFLDDIQAQLDIFEHDSAKSFATLLEQAAANADLEDRITGGLFDDSVDRGEFSHVKDVINPETNFVNLMQYGILGLQLLPENSSAGFIILTDGMVALPDANTFESLLTQLRNSTISCSFLKIGVNRHHNCVFGHIAHTELLQFIATATFGAYFAACPNQYSIDEDCNVYHRAFLFWNFQKGVDLFQLDDSSHDCYTKDMEWTSSVLSGNETLVASPMMMRRKHSDGNLNTPISSVMSVRLREGYTIKSVAINKGDSQIEVCMMLPWRENARIEYLATSGWPLDNKKRVTHIEITVEGSYEFLHDVTCSMVGLRSPYRTAIVKKYWQALQGLTQTDKLLVHLHSIATNSVFYTLPEGIKKGVPLFYLPQNSSTPALSLQLSTKDTTLSQFASFWRPVVMLDINIWQKWMHSHRIGIVMEHDVPLPKYLHISNSISRFFSIQSRQALESLNRLLKEWSTFVLMENHSYIKLLTGSETDDPPYSFCVLRVTSKPPCMVLRLAFLGGTPGFERNNIVGQLKEKVLALKFPRRGTQKADKTKRAIGSGSKAEQLTTSPKRKAPLQREWSEINCCIVLTKPVEKILIRYEKVPRSMTSIEDYIKDRQDLQMSHTSTTNKAAANTFSALSRYLYHQRWIWTVQQHPLLPVSMHTIGKLLSTLAKIRLQEGFHFAVTNSGITNMVLELNMSNVYGKNETTTTESCTESRTKTETTSCALQYIIFPPFTKSSPGSMSDDDVDELEPVEEDRELQIVTECWLEPQHGIVLNSTPEQKHFDGLSYKEIAQAVQIKTCPYYHGRKAQLPGKAHSPASYGKP